MVREFDRRRYLLAAALTIFVFLMGLLLGFVIEGKRVDYLNERSRIDKLDYSSLQLQSAYIDQLSMEKNCPAVSKTLQSNIIQLENTRIRLENYVLDSSIKKDDLNALKREYLLAELNYWLLAEKTKKICNLDITTILYFYSTKEECPSCEGQAFVLTYLKKAFADKLLIFALDSQFTDEPMIPMLTDHYDIKEYPTLIINGEVYQGFSSKEELLGIICPLYAEDLEACQSFY